MAKSTLGFAESDPYVAAHHRAAVRSVPLALALAGLLVIVSTTANQAFNNHAHLSVSVVTIGFGTMSLGCAFLFHRGTYGAPVMSWTWSVLVAAYVTYESVETLRRATPLTLSLITISMILLAPIAMSWIPSIVLGAYSVIVTATAGVLVTGIANVPWIITLITAAVAGLILLYLRLSTLDQLTSEQLASNQLATTDRLTGVFSRNGLLTLAAGVADVARGSDALLHVVMCDVIDLEGTNSSYGWEYGDRVIASTAQALQATLGTKDLVCRWGGNTFLGLGVGPTLEQADLEKSLDQNLELTGVALGKRPIECAVGAATARPGELSLEDLVAAAEQGMRRDLTS